MNKIQMSGLLVKYVQWEWCTQEVIDGMVVKRNSYLSKT